MALPPPKGDLFKEMMKRAVAKATPKKSNIPSLKPPVPTLRTPVPRFRGRK